MFDKYDIIVVGGGHAGCEAAHAAGKLGSKVLLITINMASIAQMSCNPAMGGVAKGQIVREIDAMGGMSGIISDQSTLQFRMLNKSKGAAMWSPRSQNDRMLFAAKWREALEENKNIDIWQDMVTEIKVRGGSVWGVVTSMGVEIESSSVILTSGTFLNGVIHIGEKQFGGGRAGERASVGITESLEKLGFESGRMKTGTPPRVDGRSLDYSKMEEQMGDEKPEKFSFSETKPVTNQRSCHITYTNPAVHEVLRGGFDKSPMFNGRIRGIGPRYCPSIEDKIDRFAERDRHQIFVEPEGWNTVEVYVNGFSTSLPEDVQYQALRKMSGFENAKMFRPGYAIEYDYFPPLQLGVSLETKLVENLFFAGQINGTTGYEEAACQGLIAGINANLKNRSKPPFLLNRSEAYIGVLIDDLVHKGTDEPYRMFTSRAEYRILLRQDNADTRLTEKSYKLGLASESRLKKVNEKKESLEMVLSELKLKKLRPEEANPVLQLLNSTKIKEKSALFQLLKRPEVSISALESHFKKNFEFLSKAPKETLEQAEILTKYDNYLEKERRMVEKFQKLEEQKLPTGIDYEKFPSLSNEAKEKLGLMRPLNLGQASRISGISPADLSVLMVYLKR
jgi:tRNA uridine 5-carboxymethylaminomethyl modification enzyme